MRNVLSCRCHFSTFMGLQYSHDNIFVATEYDKALTPMLRRLGTFIHCNRVEHAIQIPTVISTTLSSSSSATTAIVSINTYTRHWVKSKSEVPSTHSTYLHGSRAAIRLSSLRSNTTLNSLYHIGTFTEHCSTLPTKVDWRYDVMTLSSQT